MNGAGSPLLVYAIVVLFVIARFLFRELRDRKVRVRRLFITPGLVALLGLLLVFSAASVAPHDALMLVAAVAVALVLGVGIGLAVGHFTTLRLGDEPGLVVVRGSAMTVAIWLAALALRMVVRLAVPVHDLADTTIANAALVVMLAVALFFLRYRVFTLARCAALQGATREITAV